jgi:hypothetical protein
MVELEADTILKGATEAEGGVNIAFLVVGDPFGYTIEVLIFRY